MKKSKSKLIKRTYRVTESHDKKVKSKSSETVSESQVIRELIDSL